jgi:alpha-glucosidase
MVQSKTKGDFFGMFFKNSNAQSPVLKHNADGGSTLSYITTGGVIDIYFFVHGSARDIIQSYHNVIGKPTLPPFWALGWHQASWKYENQSMVEEVVTGYGNAGIPLDTVWLDIPYLDGFADFSVNATAFPSLANFTTDVLHANHQHLVVILDAGLSADKVDNAYYQMALNTSTLIMSAIYKDLPLTLKVWANETVFMDWFHAKAG